MARLFKVKMLAAGFGALALLAALLGFAMDVVPILALCGKVAALMALAALAITAGLNEAESGYRTGDLEEARR